MFEKKIFAQRLRVLRQRFNLSQERLSYELNVSKTFISDIERARRTTTIDKCYALADFFDVSLDYLVGRSDDPTRH